MIAKMSRGKDARGLAAYLHGPGRANEHTYVRDGKTFSGGVVIGGTVPVADVASGKGWATDFVLAHQQRPRVVKNVWHASLRADPTDRRLGDGEWFQIGQQLAETLGYAAHPWVMVRHADDHVHIAVSRVAHDGTVWKASHDYRSVRPVMRAAEQRLGLRQVPDQQQEPGPKTGLTQGEERRARRTHAVPGRADLAMKVRAAADLAAGGGREQFEHELASLGVGYRLNQSPTTGRINGYSFTDPGHPDQAGQPVWFTASSIDRGLSWSKLAPRLDGPTPALSVPAVSEPKKRFETRATYTARTQDESRSRYRTERVAALTGERDTHRRVWRGLPEIDPAKTAADEARGRRSPRPTKPAGRLPPPVTKHDTQRHSRAPAIPAQPATHSPRQHAPQLLEVVLRQIKIAIATAAMADRSRGASDWCLPCVRVVSPVMSEPDCPTRHRTPVNTLPVYAGGGYAFWGHRVVASLIDVAFLLPDYVLYWTVATTHSDSPIGYMLFLFQAATFVFAVVNQIVLPGRTGASLGKMAMHIKVLDEDTGRPIGMLRIFIRGLMHILDTFSLGVGYLWPLWDRRRQTFADEVMADRDAVTDARDLRADGEDAITDQRDVIRAEQDAAARATKTTSLHIVALPELECG